jgi:hypothetical protein
MHSLLVVELFFPMSHLIINLGTIGSTALQKYEIARTLKLIIL